MFNQKNLTPYVTRLYLNPKNNLEYKQHHCATSEEAKNYWKEKNPETFFKHHVDIHNQTTGKLISYKMSDENRWLDTHVETYLK
jgi:hypothetical protein